MGVGIDKSLLNAEKSNRIKRVNFKSSLLLDSEVEAPGGLIGIRFSVVF